MLPSLPAPEPLPSAPIGPALALPPQAPAPTSPVVTSSSSGWQRLLPLLLSAAGNTLGGVMGGPGAAGAGMQGLVGGYLAGEGMRAEQERQARTLEERAEAQRVARDRVKQQFINDVLTRLNTIEDPDELAQFLEFAEKQGEQFGVPPGSFRNAPLARTRAQKTLMLEAKKAIDMLQKLYPQQFTDPTFYAKGSVVFRGKPTPIRQVMEYANLGARDANNQLIPPEGVPPKAGTPAFSNDAYGNRLERAVAAENETRAQAGKPPLTPAEINTLDDTLRKTYPRLDDVPRQGDSGVLDEMRRVNLELARLRLEQARKGDLKLTPGDRANVGVMRAIAKYAEETRALGDRTGWPGVGGMGYGRSAEFLSREMGLGSDTGRQLRRKLATIFGEIAKLRGGSALTPTELLLLKSYVPNYDESVADIKSKLESLIEFVRIKEETLRELLGSDPLGSGGGAPGTGGEGGAPTHVYDKATGQVRPVRGRR